MKSNKGFTMVELLAVITILSVIMIILIPAVDNISKSTKESVLSSKINTIETSASKFGEDNINNYQKCTNALEGGAIGGYVYTDCLISVTDLVRLGYLEFDTTKNGASFISNPVTGGSVDGNILLCYDPHTITVNATFYNNGDVNYSCPAVSDSGNYSLNLGATRKDFYWGTHEVFKTKIYTKGDFKNITCSVDGPFSCSISGDDLTITLNDSGTGANGSYQVQVTATYNENSEDKNLYRRMNLGVYVVNFDIDDYTPGMCMKTFSNEVFRITGENYGKFSLEDVGDGLNATIKDDVLYMNSGSVTGEQSFLIKEDHAGLTKQILREVYNLSVETQITNVIVGEAATKVELKADGAGDLTITTDSAAASLSSNNSSFSSTITLRGQNYFYIRGNSIGTVNITIKGSLCGETSFSVNVSNIKLDNQDIPKYLYFNGGARRNNDKTQFKSKIVGSTVNDFSCTVYKKNGSNYVQNDEYLTCYIENDTLTIETTSGNNIFSNVTDLKVNVKSETNGSLDIYIPIIYRTSISFKKNGSTVSRVCKELNSSAGLGDETILIYGNNLGVLNSDGTSCNSNTTNIVFDSMTDYYLVDVGDPINPTISITNNCASVSDNYGKMVLSRHNVTSSQYNSTLPYKLGRTNTGREIIYIRENNGNRLGALYYHIYSLSSSSNSVTLGVGKQSAQIRISYAATGSVSYKIANKDIARVNVISSDTFSYDDNINKTFTDIITITALKTGNTYLTISGKECGSFTIPIYVTNVFAINLDGGTYGTVSQSSLTCTESRLNSGCSVTLPDFTVPSGITKKGWSTNPNGGNVLSVGSSVMINNNTKGTTYYAIADNPRPSCLFTNVPSDIYGKDKVYINCTDVGGGLSSDTISTSSISASNGVIVESVSKVSNITNGYKFEVIVNPNNYYGPFTLTLNEGAVSDVYGLTNKKVVTSEIISAEHEYVNYYEIGKDNKEDLLAFLYDNKDIDGSDGYTLKVYGSGDMEDFTKAPWDGYAESINNIVLSSELTNIGNNAFYGTNISNINIPNSVSSIGASAFESTSLKILNVNSETIGKRAFANNLELTSLTIGGNVRTIEQYAFSTNTNLSDITFKEGVEYIRDYAFIDSKLGNLVMPNSLQTIGDYAFYNFKGESVDIRNAYVGLASFRGTNFKEIKASTLEVEDNILYNGDILILVPDKLEGNVKIREGTSIITYEALKGFVSADEKMMSLTIPSSVTEINSVINLNIKEFIVSDDNDRYMSDNGVLYDKYSDALVSIPSYYQESSYTINSKRINSYSIMNNIILKTITLGDTVETIENNAVYGRGDLGIRQVINYSNVSYSNAHYDLDYSISFMDKVNDVQS